MIVSADEAVRLLGTGRVVAYPTETVFGLGVDVFEPSALEALQVLKGRAPERGLSVLVRDASALEAWLPSLPEPALLLTKRFWPGPLTLVLQQVDVAFAQVATEFGVGFRCSSHPVAARLARLYERPIAATSCNRSGEAPCGTACEVHELFGQELPVVAGTAGNLAPSSVVALDPDGNLRLLREGAIRFDAILEAAALSR